MFKHHTLTLVRGLILVCTAGFVLATGACRTVEGAGKDVQAAGEGVSDTAREVGPQ